MKFLNFSIIHIIYCFLYTFSIKIKIKSPTDTASSINELNDLKTFKTRNAVQLFSNTDTSMVNKETTSTKVFASNGKMTSQFIEIKGRSASNAISANSTDTNSLVNNTTNGIPAYVGNPSNPQSAQSQQINPKIIATINEYRTVDKSSKTPSPQPVVNSATDQTTNAPNNSDVKTSQNIPQKTSVKSLSYDFIDNITRGVSNNSTGLNDINRLNLNILIGNNDVRVNNENISN